MFGYSGIIEFMFFMVAGFCLIIRHSLKIFKVIISFNAWDHSNPMCCDKYNDKAVDWGEVVLRNFLW